MITRDLLSNIGKHLSQQLLIVTPIIVSVKFIKMGPTFRHLYSPTNPISARQIPTYGRAITTNIAATRDGGQLLMFPKAALKQSVALPLDPKEVAHFDIELEFNSQIPWNFSVGEQIGRKEVDFECNISN